MTLLAKTILIALSGALACMASTVYAGASYGLYKSIDSGSSWSLINIPLNNALLAQPVVPYSIALDPHDSNKIYMVGHAKADAFFASLDGGQTWTVRPLAGIGIDGTDTVKVDFSGQVIYINAYTASGKGDLLYKSTDGGATWKQITIPLLPGTNSVPFPLGYTTDLYRVDKAVAGTIYAETTDGFFKSTDYGDTWKFVVKHVTVNGTVVAGVRDLAQDPLHPNTWYAGVDHSQSVDCRLPGAVQCGMFKSTDSAVSFTVLTTPTNIVNSVAIGAPDGTVYATGNVTGLGRSVLKSTDGGNTWTPVANGFFSSDSGKLWADTTSSLVFANDTGTKSNPLHVSTDGGATFHLSTIPPGPDGCKPGACIAQEIQDLAIVPTLTPIITSVVNGASLQPGIAANTWVTIFGTNLAAAPDNWNNFIVNGALPTNVDGVSVTMQGKPAYVYYILPGQLNVLAPDLSPGLVDVTVTTGTGTSPVFNTTAGSFAPAFFAWPGNQVVATRQDFSFAVKPGTFAGTTTVAAKPGDVLILWATGFGATTPAFPFGRATPGDATYSSATPVISINNNPVVVFGAALAPGSAGLYQVAIQVPNNIPNGDYPIQAGIGSSQSPTGVILSVQSAAKQ